MPTAPLGQSPIQNLGNLYINGMQISWATTTTITVAAGQCRDSTNVNDIQFPVSIPETLRTEPFLTTNNVAQVYTASLRSSGLGGVDILPSGGVVANTLYYVYAIGNSGNNQPGQPGFNLTNLPGVILSLSATQPTLPVGYDMFRRIGCVVTNATAAPNSILVPFNQRGNANDRTMWYVSGDANCHVLSEPTGSSATAFTLVECNTVVPIYAESVNLLVKYTPATAGNVFEARPTPSPAGVASTAGQAQISGDVASVIHTDNLQIPVQYIAATPSTSFDYLCSSANDAIDVYVVAYVDQI